MSNVCLILHVLKILGHSHTKSFALWVKCKKRLTATLLGRLTCHPRREKTVLEAKYFELADQWVHSLQFNISD